MGLKSKGEILHIFSLRFSYCFVILIQSILIWMVPRQGSRIVPAVVVTNDDNGTVAIDWTSVASLSLLSEVEEE